MSEGGRSQTDLTTMLADMDSRLQRLQQELESVAVPMSRQPAEGRRAAASADPPTVKAAPAPPRQEPTPPRQEPVSPRQDPVPPRAEPRARAVRRRPTQVTTDAAIEAELLGGAQPRLARRVPPTAPVPTPPVRRPPPPPPPPVEAAPSEAIVRQTILEAEEEARQVADEARRRIAEIGARTRSLLEHSLGEPPPTEPAPAPRRRRAKAVRAARRAYDGTVVVEAGPFADVAQLTAFEDALGAIPAVEDVYIKTFEANRAHFEVQLTEPTALIVELQARATDTLKVISAGDSDLRLDIVRSDA